VDKAHNHLILCIKLIKIELRYIILYRGDTKHRIKPHKNISAITLILSYRIKQQLQKIVKYHYITHILTEVVAYIIIIRTHNNNKEKKPLNDLNDLKQLNIRGYIGATREV